jgi:peptidoglycan/xylan/chitin deacetylase (PgdA/CDA1 family)
MGPGSPGLEAAASLALALSLASCASLPTPAADAPRVRFLLSFDDGPSERSTARILGTLAANPVQPGIKALFFVQTRWAGAGGSAAGHALLRRTVAEGHVLGIHTGSADGHVDHPLEQDLGATLRFAAEDIRAAGGAPPSLVRPPNWRFDQRTLDTYREARLEMLLTDLSARDGSLVLFQEDPDRGGRLLDDLRCLRARVERRTVPRLDGVVPVVVTFHDPNGYTARNLARYLATLVRAAGKAGFALASPPFFDQADAVTAAAHARAPSTRGWRSTPFPICPD